MSIKRILVAIILFSIAFQSHVIINYVKFAAVILLLVIYCRYLNYLALSALLFLYWIIGCNILGQSEYLLFLLNASACYFIIKENKNFIDSKENQILILLVGALKILAYLLELDGESVSYDELTNLSRYGLYAGDANYNSIIAIYFTYCALRFKGIILRCFALVLSFFLFIVSGSKTIILALFGYFIYLIIKNSFIFSLALMQLIWFYLISVSDAPTLSFRYELVELMFGNYSFNIFPNEFLYRDLTKIKYENYSVHSHSTLVTLLYDQGILIATSIIYGATRAIKSFIEYNVNNKLNILFIYAMISFAVTNDLTYSLYAIYVTVMLSDVQRK